jgi:hypothetical protein
MVRKQWVQTSCAQVVADKASIQSKGKTITRNGDEDNPAVKARSLFTRVACTHMAGPSAKDGF